MTITIVKITIVKIIIRISISSNRNLCPDRIISFSKIKDSWKSKNYKIRTSMRNIHSCQKLNLSKDQYKLSNKNPLSIKDNYKNKNYNNNQHNRILFGDKTETIDHNNVIIILKINLIINSTKISGKRKRKNYKNNYITTKILISMKHPPHQYKCQPKKILKDKMSAKRQLSKTDTQIHS